MAESEVELEKSKLEDTGKKQSKLSLIGRFFTYSILANGPWLLVIVCSTIAGYYIAQALLPPEQEMLGLIVSLSTPLSLILTAGFQVISTKVVLDKIAVGEYKTAARFAIKILTLTVVFCLVTSSIAIGLDYAINADLTTGLLFALQFSALSLLWVVQAPILGIRKFGQLTLIFAIGVIFGYILSVFMAPLYGAFAVIGFQSLGFFLAAIGTFAYLNSILKEGHNVAAELAAKRVALFRILEDIRIKFEKGEIYVDEYKKLVKEFGQLLVKVEHDISSIKPVTEITEVSVVSSIKAFLPLFLANTIYFLVLWADRFFVWFVGGQISGGLVIAFNTYYEVAINTAQWILIPGIGLIAVLMELFTPNFQKAVSGTYKVSLYELEDNLNDFNKFFRKLALITIGVVAAIVVVLNIFATNIISIFINLSDPAVPLIDLLGYTMPAPLFVYRVATIGVIFHTTTILAFLGLM
ncbi:MAG: exopolysaccharide Pel transporter PelG, partial [Candidatus Odinarchaeia archaeon]